jgi:hypothetical protein
MRIVQMMMILKWRWQFNLCLKKKQVYYEKKLKIKDRCNKKNNWLVML